MPPSYETLIDPRRALTSLGAPGWRFLDCRHELGDGEAGRRAHAEGHVPGALHLHLDHDLSASVVPGRSGRHPLPTPEIFAARARAWGIGAGEQVVAYDDQGGAFAARLWWMLRWIGHDEVAVLDGGWRAWTAEGGPVEQGGVPLPAPGKLRARPRPELALEVDALEAIVASGAATLLDARDAARYRGEVEPIDPVAGHIPGARSLPFQALLDPDTGRFLPQAAMRERIDAALAGEAPARAVAYCGSGVTACHLLLAMAHAGMPGARLYPGSWSEWITDPARGVELGPGGPDATGA